MIFLHVCLALVAFLIALNGYLRGKAKDYTFILLTFFGIALVGISFIFLSWKSGIIAMVLSLIYFKLTKSIARAFTRKILGYRTAFQLTRVTDYERLHNAFMRREIPSEEFFQLLEKDWEKNSCRLKQIASKKQIAKILKENGKNEEDFEENFMYLLKAGLGNLSWEIISNPNDLKLLLELRDQGLSPDEVLQKFMES